MIRALIKHLIRHACILLCPGSVTFTLDSYAMVNGAIASILVDSVTVYSVSRVTVTTTAARHGYARGHQHHRRLGGSCVMAAAASATEDAALAAATCTISLITHRHMTTRFFTHV